MFGPRVRLLFDAQYYVQCRPNKIQSFKAPSLYGGANYDSASEMDTSSSSYISSTSSSFSTSTSSSSSSSSSSSCPPLRRRPPSQSPTLNLGPTFSPIYPDSVAELRTGVWSPHTVKPPQPPTDPDFQVLIPPQSSTDPDFEVEVVVSLSTQDPGRHQNW